jgi:hypothetical protein
MDLSTQGKLLWIQQSAGELSHRPVNPESSPSLPYVSRREERRLLDCLEVFPPHDSLEGFSGVSVCSVGPPSPLQLLPPVPEEIEPRELRMLLRRPTFRAVQNSFRPRIPSSLRYPGRRCMIGRWSSSAVLIISVASNTVVAPFGVIS